MPPKMTAARARAHVSPSPSLTPIPLQRSWIGILGVTAVLLTAPGWGVSRVAAQGTPAGGTVALAHFGDVVARPAILPSGVEQPFRSVDCNGDGDQDLAIAWSLGGDPAVLDFMNAFGGALPTRVTLMLLTDNAVVRAYDTAGTLGDTATAQPSYFEQTLVVEHAGGIERVTLEGTQMCLTDVCWFRSGDPEFIRGDANTDGAVNIADVVTILQYVFGGTTISCTRAADTNASQIVDISDAIFLIDVLFVGSSTIGAPYPICGPAPNGSPLSCNANPACPGGETICAGSPELGTSPFAIQLRSGVLEPSEGIDVGAILNGAVGPTVHFLVQAWQLPLTNADFGNLDVQVLEYVGGNSYVVVADTNAVPGVPQVPNLRWAGPLHPVLKLAPELQGGDPSNEIPWAVTPNGEVGLIAFHHYGVSPSNVVQAIQAAGGTLLEQSAELRLCQLTIPASLVQGLAAAEELQFLEAALPPLEPQNDKARTNSQVDPLRGFPYGLTGHGVTVAVYDGGNVDSNHPDFSGRVIQVESPLEGSDGHATHVAGTIGGNGLNSPFAGGTPGQFAGIAPGVDIRSFGYGLSFNPLFGDVQDLIENVRSSSPTDLVNMSLGNNVVSHGFSCSQLGVYTGGARQVDAVVLGDPTAPNPIAPIPMIQSVGNERSQGAPCGQFGTVSSPATAKNSITVGAVGSNGFTMTAFSSFGPTRDGRIRPDLVATGCVTSTEPGGGYGGRCGTSMASPVVTGVSALLLEEWRWLYHPDVPVPKPIPPHTLKAILIHSATDLGPAGPDYTFGWGAVNAKAAVDLIRADFVSTSAFEPLIQHGQVNAASSMTFVTEFDSDGAQPEKFTLVWDDPLPAPLASMALVNDLDLSVTDPSGAVHNPWRPDPSDTSAPASEGVDDKNNVEQVVAPPMAGVWTVVVTGTRLPDGGSQPFTLVRRPSLTFADCDQQIHKTIELTPAWNSGDRDYDGHGPRFEVNSTVEVRDGNEVWMTLAVNAQETVSDFTAAEGTEEHLVYYDPNVASVTLMSPTLQLFGPFETNGHDPVSVDLGSSGVMRSLLLYGDVNDSGPEAGASTRVVMNSNPIQIDCVGAAMPSHKRVIEVAPVFFLPPRLGPGDADFDGHGPDLNISVTLAIGGPNSTQLVSTVFMTATEGCGDTGDGTLASGLQSFVLYTHTGPIASILTPTGMVVTFCDQDHLDDRPAIPPGGLVRGLRVVGDTDGPEAGTRTSVIVDYSPIRFMVQ
ncbi:MAG: S8 family serine peptidase [Planctomycetota bacterium]